MNVRLFRCSSIDKGLIYKIFLAFRYQGWIVSK